MEANRFEGHIPERLEPPEGTKGERLSDEEMGNLISAIGNHEVKAITLGAMEYGHLYTSHQLYRTIIDVQGGNVGWKTNSGLPFNYCRYSLEPIGLVAKEVISPDLSTIGYMKTQKGKSEGEALAGLMLDFSLKYPDFSLQDFFGSTASSSKSQETQEGLGYKKRSPTRRAKIFWELLSSDLPLRTADLTKKLQEAPQIISKDLVALSKTGIISYHSTRQGEPFSMYKISAGAPLQDPEGYKHEKLLTIFVYRLLKDNPDEEWTIESVAREFLKSGETRRSEKTAAQGASLVMSYLKNKGYLERSNLGFGKASEINLSEDQKNMIFNLVYMLSEFQNQDPDTIAFGRKRLAEILANPSLVSNLMAKAREHSSSANQSAIEETAERIYTIISSSPNSDVQEIQKILSYTDKRLTRGQIHKILRSLRTNGRITKNVVRGVSRYHIEGEITQAAQENK